MRGYNSGAVDFILKPFDPAMLCQKIHNLLLLENNRRELHHLSQQLERERAFNASVLANAAEGILVVGEDGAIQYANPAMARMLHSQIETITSSTFLDLLKTSGEKKTNWQQSAFYQHWKARQTYRVHEAVLRTNNDHHTLPVTISCAPLPHPQRAMVVIVRDISIEHNLRQQLEALIITDPLTGLLNRRGFYQAVESALSRVKRSRQHLAIIYMDLDGFKHINDSLGHDVGDELLCQVSKQLQSGLRAYDALARLGGDEFTVLLDSLDDYQDAACVADKLMQLVSGQQTIGGVEFTLSASAGIAASPECGDDVESLLRAADMAMYEAKRNGRQQYCFHSPQMTARAHARLELEQRLRHAIEKKQFSLVYQPQFHLDSGRLRGFEALLRWTHGNPEGILPGQFIPLLEETRLIAPLGQWIFAEGIARLADLRQHFGNDLQLSLNVSPVQFAFPQLVETFARLLNQHGLNPAQLEVEVTEGALMQNLETARTQLHQLHELKIKIAVDDFGTGYSSLAYLRQFELDTLKIDRLFIANMLDSPRDAAVVSTIIDLANRLGLQVIAEGVETRAQRQWLLDQQCSIMQGYLVAPGLCFADALQVPAQLDWDHLPLEPASNRR